uniref:Integrating conjugative element protein PilL, PFGI-1 n=1 Tax=Shewanella putrefaciens (strain 200) TaxID=399804 RepID=E6XSE2_SHEP2
MKTQLFSVTFAAIGLVTVSPLLASEAEYKANGLALIKISPIEQQQRPLAVVATIEFPNSISTVGQAIHYTLLKTGYEIEDRTKLDEETRLVLTKDLPLIHRKFEYASVEQIIQSLVGSPFKITYDEIQRKVSIKPKSSDLEPNKLEGSFRD